MSSETWRGGGEQIQEYRTADGSENTPKCEIFINADPLQKAVQLNNAIWTCVAEIKRSETGSQIEGAKCSQLTRLLLQAVQSDARHGLKTTVGTILNDALQRKNMSVEEMLAGFESGKFKDFQFLL